MNESTMRDPREAYGRCGAPGEIHGPVRFKFGHGPHGHGFGPHGHGPWSRARRGNVRAAIFSVLSEEPMHGYLIEHAELQRRIATPVCLDESIKGPRDFRLALKIQACRVVNVKPGRVGGLHNAVQIHNMARDAGVTAWVGGMLESGVGVGICGALATLPGFTYPADMFPSRRFYRHDLTDPEIEFDGRCHFRLGERPGVGFEPVPERLEAVTVARHSFAA